METELKFQVPPEHAARLYKAIATHSAVTTRLQAVYFDTPDHRLAMAGMALRLRKEGRIWVQTLKGRGDGLMNRLEHEVPLPAQRGEPTLDPKRHAGTPVGERLRTVLAGAPLQALYRTDIRRLHRCARFAGATIEIAYDRGWLIAGAGEARRRLAVDEVEFELIKGAPQSLTGLAMKWMARYGLWWDSRTKSERGMRLAMGVERVPAVVAGSRQPVRGMVGWQNALSAALAHALPNAAEIASGLGSAAHEAELQRALRRLRELLRLSSVGELRGSAQELYRSLQQLQAQPGWTTTGLPFNALMLSALSLSLPLSRPPDRPVPA